MLCARTKRFFTGERTEWPGNVAASKHVSMHTSSEIRNYTEKFQYLVYEQKELASCLSRPFLLSEMTYYVSSGALNTSHVTPNFVLGG